MAIIGSILGDIVGSQYEFSRMRPKDLDWKNCELFTDKCRFTDDTVMTLAAKLAILNGNSFEKYYRKLGREYENVGYGGMFSAWLLWDDEKAYNSFGNGSAMRCSYVGEYANTESEVIDLATKSAICTHNHPEGVKGAIVTSMCIYLAKKGASKAEIYDYVVDKYPSNKYLYGVDKDIKGYRDTYRWNDICQNSVPTAIRCFLESEDYESFLRNVFSLKCDMDTLCAIGGGIAEEFYGETGFNNDSLLKKYLDDRLYQIVKM